MTKERWLGVAYLVPALAILAWVTWDAWSFRLITESPGADYWEHTAVLRALLNDPWHPSHPLIASEVSSPRFGPHFLAVALAGRALELDALGAMSLAATLDALLFLLGIFCFFREYFRDARAPLLALAVLFGSWLDAPHFSNVYKLSIYFSVAGYPSSAALAVMLLGLTVLLRLLRAPGERPRLWAASAVTWGYVYVTHPLTAMLAFTAAGLLALTEPEIGRHRRLWALGSIAAGLLLASLWPYYPALGMVASGTADRVRQSIDAARELPLHPFYEPDKLVGIFGFSALAVLAVPYFVWKRRHLFVPLGAIVMLAVFAVSPFFDVPLGHRFALLAVFFLQVGLIWLLLAALPKSFGRSSGETRVVHAGRLAAGALSAALLVFMAVTNVAEARERFERHDRGTDVESPTVRYGRRVAELAGPNAVIFGEPLASWPIPTFGPKIVTLHHGNPLISDIREREHAARRFFSSKGSDAERRAILERFRVTHVVVAPRRDPTANRFLARHGQRSVLPLGRLLYRLHGAAGSARAPSAPPAIP